MIMDASPGLKAREQAADVVIVGAGPAGLAVATQLATDKLSVLVLDSGGREPAPDHDAGRGRVDGRLPYFDLSACRPRGLGGSTGLWGGWCEPLSELDFQPRPGLPGTGWCITRRDLEPHYRQARAFCGIPDTTPSRPWGRAEEQCVRDSPFDPISFPVLGPRQLGRRHEHIFTSDRTDLILNATATRVVTTPDGKRVDHLLVSTPGGAVAMAANRFVLAAGGIENARLLLSSTSTAWPDGVGNEHGLVGRNFMEHPHIDAMRLRGDQAAFDVDFFLERHAGTTIDGEPMAAAGALVLSEEACRTARIGRVQLFIEPAGNHVVHPLPRRWQGRALRLNRPRVAGDDLTVIVATEQLPNPNSRITLSDTRDRFGVPLPVLHWDLTDLDHRTAHVGVDAVRPLLHHLGARDVRRRLPRAGWLMDTLGGPHHLGTARMSGKPTDGVVNADCRVREVENLFVAGGAVFPTSGYAPPTLTIIALALRLADHLAQLDS